MQLKRLWLTDFRNYRSADLSLGPGLTAVVGDNGQGKSNLLEAAAYLATLSSFRGAPTEAMVRLGTDRAVVRGEAMHHGRELLIETELVTSGRSRAQLNRQPLRRASDLLGSLQVTVFSPDDLVMVKGGPGERRRYLDDVLVSLHRRHDELRSDLDRILRQRNTLLKQAGGRLADDIITTLDVWDAKLTETGEAVGHARAELVARLSPALAQAYGDLAPGGEEPSMSYAPAWRSIGLATALAASRGDDLRRALTLVGPHRDELDLAIGGRPARTHASQGEQRSLALSLRLAAHRLITDAIGSPPVLLLDDVFSELDPARSHALVEHLPAGQAVLTTASTVPDDTRPELVLAVADGSVRPVG